MQNQLEAAFIPTREGGIQMTFFSVCLLTLNWYLSTDYVPKLHLEPSRTSTMELFRENT